MKDSNAVSNLHHGGHAIIKETSKSPLGKIAWYTSVEYRRNKPWYFFHKKCASVFIKKYDEASTTAKYRII